MNKPTPKLNSSAVEILLDGAKRLDVQLSDEQVQQIGVFVSELASYNSHTNLVSNADAEVVVRNHVIDSLSLVSLVNSATAGGGNLIDIGAGAGFPGIVLAIVCPALKVTLVDSIGKKTKFLAEAASALGFSNRIDVVTGRAEDIAHDKKYRERFQIATARAVGKLDLVTELTLPLLKIGGRLLAQKSREQSESELAAAHDAIELLGGKYIETVAPDMEALGRDVVVVVIEKTKATASKYPRPGAQLKRPIK